jgi:dihydroxy-acid dehydratase
VKSAGATTGLGVGHVAPEATDGAPIALVRDGDPIVLDMRRGTLDLDLDAEELARRAAWTPTEPTLRTGVLGKSPGSWAPPPRARSAARPPAAAG